MSVRTAAFAAAMGIHALAAAAAPTLEECKAIRDKLQRADCYDEFHGRTADDAGARPRMTLPAPASSPVPAAAATTATTTATAPAVAQAPLHVSPFANVTLDKQWDLDSRHHDLFLPATYRPMYVLLANWTDRTNPQPSSPAPGHDVASPYRLRPIEAKYQISFKSKFWQSGNGISIWGAYTQSSRWQVYNPADSRPFRETNYEPEVIAVFPLAQDFAGGRLRMATLAFNHQSNGRALPLSRSWNRVIGSVVWESGNWTAEVRPWWRVPEGSGSDDNPDISNYVGRGELRVTRRFNEQFVALQLRHSLRSGSRSRGSAQVDWVFPIPGLPALHGQLQVSSGYGESLIDYNVKQNRIGFGFTIAGWQ